MWRGRKPPKSKRKASAPSGWKSCSGCSGAQQRRDNQLARAKPVGDAEGDHGIGDQPAFVRRIAERMAVRDGRVRLLEDRDKLRLAEPPLRGLALPPNT